MRASTAHCSRAAPSSGMNRVGTACRGPVAAQGWGQSPKLVSPQLLISVLSSWWSACWPVPTPPHPPLLPHNTWPVTAWGGGCMGKLSSAPREPLPQPGNETGHLSVEPGRCSESGGGGVEGSWALEPSTGYSLSLLGLRVPPQHPRAPVSCAQGAGPHSGDQRNSGPACCGGEQGRAERGKGSQDLFAPAPPSQLRLSLKAAAHSLPPQRGLETTRRPCFVPMPVLLSLQGQPLVCLFTPASTPGRNQSPVPDVTR